MKPLCKICNALLIFMNLFGAMPQVVSVQEIADTNVANNGTKAGIAETGLPSKESVQMINNKRNEQIAGECYELEIGESIVLGSTADGGIITMTCAGSSMDLTRAGKKTYPFNSTLSFGTAP